jgi:hypothetical protein
MIVANLGMFCDDGKHLNIPRLVLAMHGSKIGTLD